MCISKRISVCLTMRVSVWLCVSYLVELDNVPEPSLCEAAGEGVIGQVEVPQTPAVVQSTWASRRGVGW